MSGTSDSHLDRRARLELVTGPPPDGWDDLVMRDTDELPPHELYTSARWLRAISMLTDVPMEHLVLSDGDRLLGALVTRPVQPRHPHPRIALDDLVPPEVLPARLVGGLYDGRTGPLLDPGSPSEHRDTVVELFDAAEDLARSRGEGSVVCRSIDADDTWSTSLLAERGYALSPGVDHLVLRPSAGGLPTYIGGFDGRYRNMIRRERRKLADAGVEVATEPLSPALIDEVAPLVVNLSLKHGVDDDQPRAAGRLRMVRRFFRGDTWAVVARLDGVPIGFLELMVHRGSAWGGHVGFDYEAQGTLPVYFGTLFYGVMDLAAQQGWGLVDYAVGTDAAKRARGCVARPTVVAVKRL